MRKSRRFILAVTLGLALASPAWAGISYKAVTETKTPGGRGGMKMLVDAQVEGDKARIEFKESNNPMMGRGSVMITDDCGKTIYLVNPKEKTYSRWDVDAMAKLLGGVMGGMGGMFKMEISNPKVEKLLEEPGPSISGVATTHVRTKSSYAMSMKVLGMNQASKVESVQDVRVASSLTDLGFGVWLRKEPPKTGHADLDRLIAAEMDKVTGVPLKMVTVQTSTDTKKGQTTTTETTMEVTELKTGVAPAGAESYRVPAGFKEVELFPAEAGNPFAVPRN